MAKSNREYRIDLPLLNVATPGQPCRIDVESLRGLRIKQLVFEVGDSAEAATDAPALSALLNEIRFEYGKGMLRKLLASELDTIQTDYGSTFSSTHVAGAANGGGRRYLTMNFCEPSRGNLKLGDLLGLETHAGAIGANGKLKLEVDIDSTVATMVLNAYAMVDNVQTSGPHVVVAMEAHDIETAGDTSTISKILDTDPSEEYLQFSIFDTDDDKTVENVLAEVLEEGRWNKFHDLSKNVNKHVLKTCAEMTQTAGVYHVVCDASGTLNPGIPGAGVRLKSTFSAASAGQYRVVTQRLVRAL